jgi:hypothetical protein
LYTTRLTTHPSKTPALQELFRLSDKKEINAFLKDTDYPVVKLTVPPDAQLSWCADEYMPDTAFDLYADPEQESPLRDPILLARLRQEMIAAMSRERFPPEQFERLRLM